METEVNGITAVSRPLTSEMSVELTKLGRDLKSAEKMDEYFKAYEKRMTQQPPMNAMVSQRPTGRSENRFQTPNKTSMMQSSLLSSIPKPPSGDGSRRNRDDSGYSMSYRNDGQRSNTISYKSTPLPGCGNQQMTTTPSTQ